MSPISAQSSYSMFLILLFCFSLSLSIVCATPSLNSEDSNPIVAQVYEGLVLINSRANPNDELYIHERPSALTSANDDSLPSTTEANKRIITLPPPAGAILPLLSFLSISFVLFPFVYIFRRLVQTLRKMTITRPGVLELTESELLPMSMSQHNIPTPDPVLRNNPPALGIWVGQSNVGCDLPQRPGSAPPLNQIERPKSIARTTSFERLPIPAASPSKRRHLYDYAMPLPTPEYGESIRLVDLHPLFPEKRRNSSMGGAPRLSPIRLSLTSQRPYSSFLNSPLSSLTSPPPTALINFSPPSTSHLTSALPPSSNSATYALSIFPPDSSNNSTATKSNLGTPRTPGLGLRTALDLAKDKMQWKLNTTCGEPTVDVARFNDSRKGNDINKWGNYGIHLGGTGGQATQGREEEYTPLIGVINDLVLGRSSLSSDTSAESDVPLEAQDIALLPSMPPYDSRCDVGGAAEEDKQVLYIRETAQRMDRGLSVYRIVDDDLIDLENGLIGPGMLLSPDTDDPFSDLLHVHPSPKTEVSAVLSTDEPSSPELDSNFTVDATFPSSFYLNVPGYGDGEEPSSPIFSPLTAPSPFMEGIDVILPTPLIKAKSLFPDVDQSSWEQEEHNWERDRVKGPERVPDEVANSPWFSETNTATHLTCVKRESVAESEDFWNIQDDTAQTAAFLRPSLALDTSFIEQGKGVTPDDRQDSPTVRFVLFDSPLTSSPGEMTLAASPTSESSSLPGPFKSVQLDPESSSPRIRPRFPSTTVNDNDNFMEFTVILEEFFGPAQPPEYHSPVKDATPNVIKEIQIADPDEVPLPNHTTPSLLSTHSISPISPIYPLGVLLTPVASYASGSGLSSPTVTSSEVRDKAVPASQPMSPVSQTPTPPASPPFPSFNLPMSEGIHRSSSGSSSCSTVVPSVAVSQPKAEGKIQDDITATEPDFDKSHIDSSLSTSKSFPIFSPLDGECLSTSSTSSLLVTGPEHAAHAPTLSQSSPLPATDPVLASMAFATGIEVNEPKGSELKLRAKAKPESTEAIEGTNDVLVRDETQATAGQAEAVPKPARFRFKLPPSPFAVVLVLQLRPRLGTGLDVAWIAQFLMAVFGWFTFSAMPWKGKPVGATKVETPTPHITPPTERVDPQIFQGPQVLEQ